VLFFPSHDIALGNGVKHFNPPAAAQQLQEDLAWLSEIWNQDESTPLPWGWDWDTRNYLHKNLGIKIKELPSDEQLEAIRQLSSRKTTIDILRQMGFADELPSYLDSEKAVSRFIEEHDAVNLPFALKTPWSSSGRGLIRSSNTPRDIMKQRAFATLRKMGGIIGERWYNKQKDFAMLFKVTQNEVQFVGYSLFDNEENGTYRQGYLLSNEAIEECLGCQAELHDVRERLLSILNDLFAPFFHLPWQLGYIGIDMMLYSSLLPHPSSLITHSSSLITHPSSLIPHHSSLIHPCVEMNVRCTMGVVCRLWSDLHLKQGERGLFRISPMGTDGHFQAQFELSK